MTTLLSILVLAMGPLAVPADAPALCADQPGQVEMAFDPGVGEQSACNATANCTEGPDVYCSGNSNCTAVDQSCPYTRGYVVCDGTYTYCPVCPPVCTDGQITFIPTGYCCDDALTEKDKYKCINQQWVYQDTVCRLPLCGPRIP